MPEPGPQRAAASPRAGIGTLRPRPHEVWMKRSALPLVCGRYGRVRRRRIRRRAGRRGGKTWLQIDAAVVGEDPLDADAPPRKPLDGAGQEGRRRRGGLRGQDFHIGGPTVVVERDVDVLLAGATVPASAGPHGRDGRRADARQRLDIEMHELARLRPLVAGDRRGRCRAPQAIQARPAPGSPRPSSAAPGAAGRSPTPVNRSLAGGEDRLMTAGRRPPRLAMRRRGPIRERRPRRRHDAGRATCRRSVAQCPPPRPRAATVQCWCRTRWTSRARMYGVVLALG